MENQNKKELTLEMLSEKLKETGYLVCEATVDKRVCICLYIKEQSLFGGSEYSLYVAVENNEPILFNGDKIAHGSWDDIDEDEHEKYQKFLTEFVDKHFGRKVA